jgi:O-methyltransferase
MPQDVPDARALYLDLMERCLLNTIYEDPAFDLWREVGRTRSIGAEWPSVAHTMIGRERMANLRQIVRQVLADDVRGDLMETGVWRGGACIYMRAILQAYGVTDRRVVLADSFDGLPSPDAERYPADAGNDLHTFRDLAVPLEEVRANFARYGLLDDQVVFLKGWFRDMLPAAPVERLAVLRLDGDMYESTMDALTCLYDKVSPGGFVIVDDYEDQPTAERAVTDFRAARSITEPMADVEGSAVWRKPI